MSLIGLLLVLVQGPPAGPVPLQGSCAEACYQQKSTAYEQCRNIPPAKRDQRARCFREADAALRRCLAGCR